jgi:hypothetical protein
MRPSLGALIVVKSSCACAVSIAASSASIDALSWPTLACCWSTVC